MQMQTLDTQCPPCQTHCCRYSCLEKPGGVPLSTESLQLQAKEMLEVGGSPARLPGSPAAARVRAHWHEAQQLPNTPPAAARCTRPLTPLFACAAPLQICEKKGQPNAVVTALKPNKISVVIPGVTGKEQIGGWAAPGAARGQFPRQLWRRGSACCTLHTDGGFGRLQAVKHTGACPATVLQITHLLPLCHDEPHASHHACLAPFPFAPPPTHMPPSLAAALQVQS